MAGFYGIVDVSHVVHVLAAGIWLGGLVFTATVVSPAFKRMGWPPVERIAVRAELGRQYSRVARINLAILLLAAIADGAATGWPRVSVVETVMVMAIAVLSALHARVHAPRLASAAQAEDQTALRQAVQTSVRMSVLNLFASAIVVVLAVRAVGLKS
jgi:uncharacterized membrane protein